VSELVVVINCMSIQIMIFESLHVLQCRWSTVHCSIEWGLTKFLTAHLY
jgi:hypothetical protein